MAFASWPFVAVFLPLTLSGFVLLGWTGHKEWVKLWLIATSLVFYGWLYPPSIGLLVGSILFNYVLAKSLKNRVSPHPIGRNALLTVGIAANLVLLAYFKYRNFFLEHLSFSASSLDVPMSWAAPLGLSFLTFQQIAYLVDNYRGVASGESLVDYGLFVTFFPKLMAGPIIRQTEFVPQLGASMFGTFSASGLAEGVTFFAIGLFKKVVLADSLAPFADAIFNDADAGIDVNCWQAWGGMLAYTFQLYFDFAGYTDMAIGLGLMFGLRLPANFNLPYTASSIRDFWRRWHMTFSLFLRNYLYIPLGGSRTGPVRTSVNLMLTMLIGGLWHGVEWTFIVWGALHGSYLIMNHVWNRLGVELPRALGWVLTFLGVAYAWVWFRAMSVDAAARISQALVQWHDLFPENFPAFIRSLANLQPLDEYINLAKLFDLLGVSLTVAGTVIHPGNIVLSKPVVLLLWLILAGLVAFLVPNFVDRTASNLGSSPLPLTSRHALFVGVLICLVMVCSITVDRSPFVYLQF